jgi:hypothetical protein
MNTIGDDAGLVASGVELEPGDVVVLKDGREALVTARVEAKLGPPCGAAGGRARNESPGESSLSSLPT